MVKWALFMVLINNLLNIFFCRFTFKETLSKSILKTS